MEKYRVLFVAQEMDPYLLIGHMADVVRRTALAVQDSGMEIRVLMPRFGNINERRNRLHEVVRLSGINIVIDGDDYPLIIKVASCQVHVSRYISLTTRSSTNASLFS